MFVGIHSDELKTGLTCQIASENRYKINSTNSVYKINLKINLKKHKKSEKKLNKKLFQIAAIQVF